MSTRVLHRDDGAARRPTGALSTVRAQDGEDETRCYEVMPQLASIKGATRGLMAAYMEGFVRDHVTHFSRGLDRAVVQIKSLLERCFIDPMALCLYR